MSEESEYLMKEFQKMQRRISELRQENAEMRDALEQAKELLQIDIKAQVTLNQPMNANQKEVWLSKYSNLLEKLK